MTAPTNTKYFDMNSVFQGLGRVVRLYNEMLAQLDIPHVVDEVAYMFADRHLLDLFTREAVQVDGCLLFNTADDHVHTMPLGTCYDVEYRFFTVPMEYLPGIEQVRIEAMRMGRGFSPLHLAEVLLNGWGAIHASFKCQTEEEYGAVLHRLRERSWEVAQKCDSTYGKFSYWKPFDQDNHEDLDLYLKPRVNLRDSGMHSD